MFAKKLTQAFQRTHFSIFLFKFLSYAVFSASKWLFYQVLFAEYPISLNGNHGIRSQEHTDKNTSCLSMSDIQIF